MPYHLHQQIHHEKGFFSLWLGALSSFYSAESSDAITCDKLRSDLENEANLITSIDDDGDLKIPHEDFVVCVIAKDADAARIHFSNPSREIDSIRIEVYSKRSIENAAKRERMIRDFNEHSIIKMRKVSSDGIVMSFYLSELNEATGSYVKKAVRYGISALTSSMDSIIQQEL